jgi:putative ABC transport system permease protein
MGLWRHVSRGVRALVKPDAADRDIADEVHDFFDRAVAAHLEEGLSLEQAKRAARLELGNPRAIRDEVRSYGWQHAVETIAADIRYGARQLRAAPAFTAVAILTLALGLGATTAIFSALRPILLAPLDYPEPNRIVAIIEARADGSRTDGTFGMYRWLAERSRSLEAIAVVKAWQPTVTGVDQPERPVGLRATASYFQTLGVSPSIGRAFTADEDQAGGPTVVVLSDSLWWRRFARDPSAIGREIVLDERRYTIVGVMPPSFEDALTPGAELWAPLQYAMSQGRAWGHHLRTIARLRASVTMAQAADEIQALGGLALTELRPVTYARHVDFLVARLGDEMVRDVKPTLLIVAAAVGLLLVIACVNVTNLLIARGIHRRAEFALRIALGAGRGRLIRQLLTECWLLAVLGGVAGIFVAEIGVRALVAIGPAGVHRLDAMRVDAAVFAFAFSLAALVGSGIGLVAAVQAAQGDPQRSLQHGSPRIAGGLRRARGALVVVEVALALMLLIGSGLLLRSLLRLFGVPPGFDPADVVTVQVAASGRRFDQPEALAAYFAEALEAVRRVPGVISAGFTSQLPLSGDRDEYGVRFDREPGDDPAAIQQGFNTFRYGVSPRYLETMRLPILRGRAFDEGDRAGGLPVAIISASLARLKFASPDAALGRRLQIGPTDAPFYTIVGVVGDVKQLSLTGDTAAAIYTPAAQWFSPDRVMSFAIRANGDAGALTSAVRQAIWSVDRNQPIVRAATMDELVAAGSADRRFAVVVFEAFAIAALLLAAAGIYGVLAGRVAERTREIGIRSVLGASRWMIVEGVVRDGLRLTAAGVVGGLIGAAAATPAFSLLLFGVSPLDPLTYCCVVATLTVVALAACAVPAWRAAQIDPTLALKAE